MPIYLGNKKLALFYHGNKALSAIYVGSKLIWQKVKELITCCFSKESWEDNYPWLDNDTWLK